MRLLFFPKVRTVDGDTPLLRAVRGRHAEIVQMLLDRKAKLTVTDTRGDTPLHVAMRARSKAIVEILLRNPKHSQLLYRPNKQGETPYSIDVNSTKTILGQVFGARRLNTNEDSEKMLGYDLYSSALSDILTEPTLSMPITVGLYAKYVQYSRTRKSGSIAFGIWQIDPFFSFFCRKYKDIS